MSSGLKPLLLPRLVERRKLDEAQSPPDAATTDASFVFFADNTSSSDITSPATPTFSHRSALGHLRCSSSSSSLDLVPPSPPVFDCVVPSPIQLGLVTNSASPAPTSHSASSIPKRLLPDVQEEVLIGRDDEYGLYEEYDDDDASIAAFSDALNLYDCLCDEPCFHGREDEASHVDYDYGFGSDADSVVGASRSGSRRRRYGGWRNGSTSRSESTPGMAIDGGRARADSSLANLTQRVGSRIQALSRWRSGSTPQPRGNTFVNLIGAPASEPALSPSLSRAPSRAPSHGLSSRSSSLSAPRMPISATELPFSAPVSYYGSTESLSMASPVPTTATTATAALMDSDFLDVQEEDVRRSMERDRAKATTPLLPPLFLGRMPPPPPVTPAALTAPVSMHSPSPSLQASPVIMSPSAGMFPDSLGVMGVSTTASPVPSDTAILPSPTPGRNMELLPSPPLSTKQSVSSFRPSLAILPGLTGTSSTGSLMTPMSPTSALAAAPTLELHDAWSDRLGHANYTIHPRSYRPTEVSVETLQAFWADWNLARVNYTKHLMRVGEHYGMTSNTYALTEAKWAETERAWQVAHDGLMEDGAKVGADLSLMQPLPDHVSLVVPRILGAEGKFPNLGDEDIVGPMERATAVACAPEERHGSARFWRSLGKVLRR